MNEADRRKLEGLTMAGTDEGRRAARALVYHIKRSGFSQLRSTSDGWLYGSGTYRFTLPYSVTTGSCTASYLAELTERFNTVRAQRDADFGRPRPAPEDQTPVQDPEDLLQEVDTGGQVDPGPGPVQPVEVGSIPTPPAIHGAPDSPGEPQDLTPTTEDQAVAKAKTRRQKKGDHVCDGCGRTFAYPQNLGKHVLSCAALGRGKGDDKADGKAQGNGQVRTRGRRTSTHSPALVVSLNGYQETVDGFSQSLAAHQSHSTDLLELFKGLILERDQYKRERDELAAWKAQVQQVLGVVK